VPNGLKVTSKIKKNRISRMPHSPYSPDINPYDFWFFGMLKQILRDREFSSSGEIEDAIAQICNDLTFDDVQSIFRDWIRRLAWVAENDGECISE
jgi:transposase